MPVRNSERAEGLRARAARRVLWLALLAPTLFLGYGIATGGRFLPHWPVILEPLASEHPEEAARAWERVRYGPTDRVFPALSDQIVAREELARLDLPTWAPDLGLGAPLHASSIAGLAYPPNWIGLAFPPERAAGPLAWLSLALAGLGAGLFLRRIGLGAAGCAAGVLATGCGGFGLANLGYFMKVDAALWLPWSLWAVEGLAQRKRGSAAALACFLGLSLLAGFPPIAIFGMAATAAYAAARALGPGRAAGGPPLASGEGLRLGLRVAVALALGAAIGAWQCLPMAEASARSVRRSQDARELARQALPPATLAGVIVPELVAAPDEPARTDVGPPLAWWMVPPEQWERAQGANGLEWDAYAGIVIVLLGLVALIADPRRAAVPAVGLLAVYAFAQAWPIARLAYHVPGLGAGAPNRALSVAWILWPWLAAVGVQAVADARPRARGALCALGAGAAAVALALAGRIEPERFGPALQDALLARYASLPEAPTRAMVEDVVPTAAAVATGARLEASLARAGLLAAAAAAAGLAALRRPRAGVALALAAILADGGWTAARQLAVQRPEVELFPESRALDAVRAAAGDGRVVRVAPGADTAGLVSAAERLARPNLTQVYGIADLTPWTVFTPAGLVELVGGAGERGLDPAARFRSGIAGLSRVGVLGHPLLDLLRVTCVLALEPLDHPSLEPVLERPGFCVYRRAGALPIARIVPEGLASPSDAVARGLLVSGAFDARAAALLAPGVEPRPPAPDAALATIESVARPARNRLDLVVRGSRGGLLVMHEQWFPGWKATINGEDAEILRVDHVYRGLWLPEGDLVVRTKYEPWSLRIGFASACAALAAAAWLALRRGW